MPRRALIVVFSLIAVCYTLAGQAQQIPRPFTQTQIETKVREGLADEPGAKASLSPQDIRATDHHFGEPAINMFLLMRHESLKNTTLDKTFALAPGVRGYQVASSACNGMLSRLTGHPKQDSKLELAQEACNSEVVIAHAAGVGASYFFSGAQGIVTAYPFIVDRTIQGNLSAGSTVTAVALGGTIQEDGITYKVIVSGAIQYKSGEKYLLFLSKDADEPSDAFFVYSTISCQLEGNVIIPSAGLDLPPLTPNYIHKGETVDAFAKELAMAKQFAEGQPLWGPCHGHAFDHWPPTH